jgi:hypothetical protein
LRTVTTTVPDDPFERLAVPQVARGIDPAVGAGGVRRIEVALPVERRLTLVEPRPEEAALSTVRRGRPVPSYGRRR